MTLSETPPTTQYRILPLSSPLHTLTMSGTREIITVQLGNYANYVGTHWWNIQEATFNYNPNTLEKSEINHDVLFREGENQRGQVTYTPRMILLDLAGSLSHMPVDGELYEDLAKAELLTGDPSAVQSHSGWDSAPVEVIKTGKQIEKPAYLKVQSIAFLFHHPLIHIRSLSGPGRKLSLGMRPDQVPIPRDSPELD